MRTTLTAVAIAATIALAGCGDDASKNPAPPKTSSTGGTLPAEPATATSTTGTTGATAADNTGRNANDSTASPTPLDQGSSDKDIAITQAVRKAVVAHKGLSVNAQNVKIITKDGVVTLRGPVASESERSAIVTMAEQVPEVHTVVNNLEVAAR
jgi:osmotically-inducible protein OsmY